MKEIANQLLKDQLPKRILIAGMVSSTVHIYIHKIFDRYTLESKFKPKSMEYLNNRLTN